MQNLDTPLFNDYWWDTASPKEREEARLEQYKQVILFAKDNVPFYKSHYMGLRHKKIASIKSLDDLMKTVPYITKEHIAANVEQPEIFLPEISLEELVPNRGEYWEYGTGGTTSEPILVKHSMQDWRGMALTANRHIEFDFYNDPHYLNIFGEQSGRVLETELKNRETPLAGKRIIGVYNGDHITNNIYATMLLGLGMNFHWRPSTKQEIGEVYRHAKKHRVNGILAPPEDKSQTQTKGITMDHLWEYDSLNPDKASWCMNNRFNKEFIVAFWSSLPLFKPLYDATVNDKKIPYIKGHFGSSEIAPTASTCSQNPLAFHLTHGHSDLLIAKFDLNGLVNPDQTGYILSSKIGASNPNLNNVIPSGSFFILYMTGDGGKLTEENPCACGRNTSVLYDLQRLDFHKGKQEHSCHLG